MSFSLSLGRQLLHGNSSVSSEQQCDEEDEEDFEEEDEEEEEEPLEDEDEVEQVVIETAYVVNHEDFVVEVRKQLKAACQVISTL